MVVMKNNLDAERAQHQETVQSLKSQMADLCDAHSRHVNQLKDRIRQDRTKELEVRLSRHEHLG
jgi:hypothetical protein